MPLHRDIFWVGRQWAVTGYGMQLIDQKVKGYFDIEVARLWDQEAVEGLLAKGWLNAGDFNKGLTVARARYPMPPQAVVPERSPEIARDPQPERPTLELPPEPAVPPKLERPVPSATPEPSILSLLDSVLTEPTKPQSPRPELPVQAPPEPIASNPQAAASIEPPKSEPPQAEPPKREQPPQAASPQPTVLRVQGTIPIRPARPQPVKPAAPRFSMRVKGVRAKFVAPWRVRLP
jgi:hypothetical protein